MNPVYLSTSTYTSACWAFPSLTVFLTQNLPGGGVKIFCIWCITWDSRLRPTMRKALVMKFWCHGDVFMLFAGRKQKLVLTFARLFMIWKLFVHRGLALLTWMYYKDLKRSYSMAKSKKKCFAKKKYLIWTLISSCGSSHDSISLSLLNLHADQQPPRDYT